MTGNSTKPKIGSKGGGAGVGGTVSDSSSNDDTSAPTDQNQSESIASDSLTIKDALDMLKYAFILQVRLVTIRRQFNARWSQIVCFFGFILAFQLSF